MIELAPFPTQLIFVRGDTVRFTRAYLSGINLGSGPSSINFAGYTFAAHIRRKPNDSDIVASFNISVMQPASQGKLRFLLTAAQTSAMSGRYFADLEAVQPNGETRTIDKFRLRVREDVTRLA